MYRNDGTESFSNSPGLCNMCCRSCLTSSSIDPAWVPTTPRHMMNFISSIVATAVDDTYNSSPEDVVREYLISRTNPTICRISNKREPYLISLPCPTSPLPPPLSFLTDRGATDLLLVALGTAASCDKCSVAVSCWACRRWTPVAASSSAMASFAMVRESRTIRKTIGAADALMNAIGRMAGYRISYRYRDDLNI